VIIFFQIFSSVSLAQEQVTNSPEAVENPSLEDALNNLWVLVAGILVLMMQLGFAMLEAGFNAAKNTVNVLFKNFADVCLGILVYFGFGYALMYRPETSSELILFNISGVLGLSQPYLFLDELVPRQGAAHLSVYIDFFFQAAFAATAATICSGAVAGRIKPWAYLLLTFLLTGVVYPISGYWVWGGGWLSEWGFHDFAGSLVVHAVGGSAALAVVLILKPRIGKFSGQDELTSTEENQLFPHSLPLAGIGTFILWIGWYGFNAGSALGITGDISSPDTVGKIALNTTIAACSSSFTVIVYRWFKNKRRIDLSSVLNGILGGLVAITAPCDVMMPPQSLLVGIVAGFIIIFGVYSLYALKVDDAVGAIPVHCFCGIWGGVATGLLREDINLGTQVLGSSIIFAWSFFLVLGIFKWIHQTYGIRISKDEEKSGLDWQEHGEYTYLSLEKLEKEK
jgi:Amt family ammonium transporter